MQQIRKNKIKLKFMAILTIFLFSSTALSAGPPIGRLIPNGKVSLLKGAKKVGEYRSEAPLPDNTLLSVQGQCGVKLNNAYLVATDNSLFSIRTEDFDNILAIENGTVYFALAAESLSFQTPDKMITTNKIMLNASSDQGVLKGYITVDDGVTKIGVLEGGSIILTVDVGKPIMIRTGQELLLAQADLFDIPEQEGEEVTTEPGTEAGAETGAEAGAEAVAEAETAAATATVGGISTNAMLVGLGVLAIGGAVAAGGGGGGDGAASPSAP